MYCDQAECVVTKCKSAFLLTLTYYFETTVTRGGISSYFPESLFNTQRRAIMTYNFLGPPNQFKLSNLKNFQGATHILSSTTMMSERT